MKIFTDRDVIRRLRKEGWEEVKRQGKGSHRKFRKSGFGTLTVPKGTLHPDTYRSIARKAGWL